MENRKTLYYAWLFRSKVILQVKGHPVQSPIQFLLLLLILILLFPQTLFLFCLFLPLPPCLFFLLPPPFLSSSSVSLSLLSSSTSLSSSSRSPSPFFLAFFASSSSFSILHFYLILNQVQVSLVQDRGLRAGWIKSRVPSRWLVVWRRSRMNRTRLVCSRRTFIRSISTRATWHLKHELCDCSSAGPQDNPHLSGAEETYAHQVRLQDSLQSSSCPQVTVQRERHLLYLSFPLDAFFKSTMFSCYPLWPFPSLSLFRRVTRWHCKRRWSTSGSCRWSGSRCRRRWSGFGRKLKSSTRPSGGAAVIQLTQRTSAKAKVIVFCLLYLDDAVSQLVSGAAARHWSSDQATALWSQPGV